MEDSNAVVLNFTTGQFDILSLSKMPKEADAYEYITGNENDYNYKVVEVFDHEIYEKDKLFTYMSKQKDYIFNQGTGFYERKN
jgi:hypothetical protein